MILVTSWNQNNVNGYINRKSLVVISTMARINNFQKVVPTCLIWDALTQTTGEINYSKVILAWIMLVLMTIGTGKGNLPLVVLPYLIQVMVACCRFTLIQTWFF